MSDPWSCRHGDSWSSPPLAVLASDRGHFSLDGWTVKAQARRSEVSPDVFHEWSANMITIGTATVTIPGQPDVETSAITLHLAPGDFADMPLRWSGLLEVSISNGVDTFTVLPARSFAVFPDVAR